MIWEMVQLVQMLLECAVWGAVCGAGDGAGALLRVDGRVLGGHAVWGAGAGAVLGRCLGCCWRSAGAQKRSSVFLLVFPAKKKKWRKGLPHNPHFIFLRLVLSHWTQRHQTNCFQLRLLVIAFFVYEERRQDMSPKPRFYKKQRQDMSPKPS